MSIRVQLSVLGNVCGAEIQNATTRCERSLTKSTIDVSRCGAKCAERRGSRVEHELAI